MFYELDNLVGKIFLAGVLVAAGVYGFGKLDGWCDQYREKTQNAAKSMGHIDKPIGSDGPSGLEAMREQHRFLDAWQREQEDKWRNFELGRPDNR
jgi:hypothetical protein